MASHAPVAAHFTRVRARFRARVEIVWRAWRNRRQRQSRWRRRVGWQRRVRVGIRPVDDVAIFTVALAANTGTEADCANGLVRMWAQCVCVCVREREARVPTAKPTPLRIRTLQPACPLRRSQITPCLGRHLRTCRCWHLRRSRRRCVRGCRRLGGGRTVSPVQQCERTPGHTGTRAGWCAGVLYER